MKVLIATTEDMVWENPGIQMATLMRDLGHPIKELDKVA